MYSLYVLTTSARVWGGEQANLRELTTQCSALQKFPNHCQQWCLGLQGQRGSQTNWWQWVGYKSEEKKTLPSTLSMGLQVPHGSVSARHLCPFFFLYPQLLPVRSPEVSDTFSSAFHLGHDYSPVTLNLLSKENWYPMSLVSHLEKNHMIFILYSVNVIYHNYFYLALLRRRNKTNKIAYI